MAKAKSHQSYDLVRISGNTCKRVALSRRALLERILCHLTMPIRALVIYMMERSGENMWQSADGSCKRCTRALPQALVQ